MNTILKSIIVIACFWLVGLAFTLGAHAQHGYSDDLLSNHYRNTLIKTSEVAKAINYKINLIIK